MIINALTRIIHFTIEGRRHWHTLTHTHTHTHTHEGQTAVRGHTHKSFLLVGWHEGTGLAESTGGVPDWVAMVTVSHSGFSCWERKTGESPKDQR